jgi:hypothetical protein
MLNEQKNENEGLNEQINSLEKGYEKLVEQNSRMLKIKDELLYGLEKSIKKIDQEGNLRSARNDLVNILNSLLQQNSEPNTPKEEDSRNLSQDEIYDKSNRGNSSKATNYITQNYEKFKQSQEAQKKSDTKFINQSKSCIFTLKLLRLYK